MFACSLPEPPASRCDACDHHAPVACAGFSTRPRLSPACRMATTAEKRCPYARTGLPAHPDARGAGEVSCEDVLFSSMWLCHGSRQLSGPSFPSLVASALCAGFSLSVRRVLLLQDRSVSSHCQDHHLAHAEHLRIGPSACGICISARHPDRPVVCVVLGSLSVIAPMGSSSPASCQTTRVACIRSMLPAPSIPVAAM
jgi:hypothetical protein